MKRFFLTFLMFVMLMPGLACGPFMGAAKAEAAQVMTGMPDCEDMGSPQKTSNINQHGFFKDCAKVDLYGADHSSLQQPDIEGKIVFAAWDDSVSGEIPRPANVRIIRGPPEWLDSSQTKPPILLTTGRFRE